jgi:hypothetical protein
MGRLPTFLLIAFACCAAAGALDQDQRLSQYAHTAWRIQDGVFSGTPQAITLTRPDDWQPMLSIRRSPGTSQTLLNAVEAK